MAFSARLFWCLLVIAAASALNLVHGYPVRHSIESGEEPWATRDGFPSNNPLPRRKLLQSFCPPPPNVGTGPSPAQTVTSAMRTCFVQVINNQWNNAQSSTPLLAAALSRLWFHDVAGGHADGSLLLNRAETTFGPNSNTRGFEAVQLFRNQIKANCNGSFISWADTVVLATAVGISRRGGPNMTGIIPLGRRDRTATDCCLANIPSPFQDAPSQLQKFQAIFGPGVSAADVLRLTITLSGAHTIGTSDCAFVRSPTDPSMNRTFAAKLRRTCGAATACPRFPLDSTQSFDNAYYQNLIARSGVFNSDNALYFPGVCAGGVCSRKLVESYAANKALFFNNFKWAFCKTSIVGTTLTCPPSLSFQSP